MIKNCFNYVGSKDRIFNIIDKNLDKSKSILIDLFCGSGVIGINEAASYKNIVLNDACWQLVETLKYFRDFDYDFLIKEIDKVIQEYQLSKTNKEGYNSLRSAFNETYSSPETFNPIVFYCLVMHSFNYNIHINSSGGFSVPSGINRSSFNKSLRNKFKIFQNELNANRDKISIKKLSFDHLVRQGMNVIQKSTFYCDPPYFSSDSSYGRIHYLGKWSEEKERKLYETLDYINDHGGTFLLSNVVENNGEINKILINWSKKYNIIDVSSDFTNCNYQRKNLGKTKEVLVRNY